MKFSCILDARLVDFGNLVDFVSFVGFVNFVDL